MFLVKKLLPLLLVAVLFCFVSCWSDGGSLTYCYLSDLAKTYSKYYGVDDRPIRLCFVDEIKDLKGDLIENKILAITDYYWKYVPEMDNIASKSYYLFDGYSRQITDLPGSQTVYLSEDVSGMQRQIARYRVNI